MSSRTPQPIELQSSAQEWPVPVADIAAQLATRGFSVSSPADGIARARYAASGGLLVPAAPVGPRDVIIQPSRLPGRVRCEIPGAHTHLAPAPDRITADLIQDASVLLPALFECQPPGDRPVLALAGLAPNGFPGLATLAPDWIVETLPAGTPAPTCRARAALVVGDAEMALLALFAGLHVVWYGEAPPPMPGAVLHADGPLPLKEALDRIAADAVPRPDRDEVRQCLAAHALFRTYPASAAGIAAAIADSVPAVPRTPPTISVIINNYNYLRFLPDAIASVEAQTRPAHEIIVVDDGSSDGSAAYVAARRGIRAIIQRNGGQGAAFNSGFAAATGEVVVFLDADDRLLPSALERIAAAWGDGIVNLQFSLEMIDAAGRSMGLYPEERDRSPGDAFGLMLAAGIAPFMPTTGNAYARAALERIMPVPAEDWRISADHYLATLLPAVGDIAHLHEPLGQYRVHGQNAHFRPHVGRGSPAFRAARFRAWRALDAALPRLIAGRHGAVARIRLHRRILLAAMTDGVGTTAQRLFEMARAPAVALSATGLPLGARLGHALLPIRLAAARLVPALAPADRLHDLAWPFPADWADVEAMAGPSRRPRLGHGAVLDASTTPRLQEVLGWGWKSLPDESVVMVEEAATLAFEPFGDQNGWLLTLHLQPDDELAPESAADRAMPLSFEASAGGSDIEWRRRAEAIDFFIPASVLRRDRRGRNICCLRVELLQSLLASRGSGREGVELVGSAEIRLRPLHVRGLSLGALPMGPTRPAPLLPAGLSVRVDAAMAGSNLLKTGWRWPDAEGAAMTGLSAGLSFATALRDGVIAVHLALDCWDETGRALLPAIHASGLDLEVYELADAKIVAFLPATALDAGGGVTLTLTFSPDPVDGSLPKDRRLRSITLHGLGWVEGRRRPGAGRHYHLAELLDEDEPTGFDKKSGKVLRSPAKLVIPAPPGGRGHGYVLTMHLTAAVTPRPLQPAALVADGLKCGLSAGNGNIVLARLPEAADGFLRFAIERDDGVTLALSWLSLTPLPDPRIAAAAELAEGVRLDAAALHPAADVLDHFVNPEGEALWLSATAAVLVLRIGPGERSRRLEVDVLTLPGQDQALTLSIDGDRATATTSRPGLETLSLPLGPSAVERLIRLRVTTSRLVNLGAVTGQAGPAMVGGAVVGVRLRSGPARRRSPSTT